MTIRPIRNDEDLRSALVEIDRLWGAAADTPEGDTLDVLITLVEAYEASRWPTSNLAPFEMLQFAISDMGHSQKELADLLGSRSQASDLLRGRRRVSLAAAQKISAAWKIPIALLVTPHRTEAA